MPNIRKLYTFQKGMGRGGQFPYTIKMGNPVYQSKMFQATIHPVKEKYLGSKKENWV